MLLILELQLFFLLLCRPSSQKHGATTFKMHESRTIVSREQ